MTDPVFDPHGGGLPSADRSEQWPADQPTDGYDRGHEDGPISQRLGRDPGNLGDDVTDLGDVTHPDPEPSDAHM